MASGEKPESNLQDVFHRLVRTLNGRAETMAASTTSTTPQQTPTQDVEVGPGLKRAPSTSSKSNKEKSSISERLKTLGKDLGMLRKGSTTKPSDTPLSQRTTLVTIPGTTTALAEAGPSRIQSGSATISHAKLLSMVEEESAADTPPPGTVEPPEPTVLAQRIQMLVGSLPTPNSDISRSPRITEAPLQDPSGRPIPPPNPTPIQDSRFKALLNSATIMNGSSEGGRPSMWSVLESLGVPRLGGSNQTGDQHKPGEGNHEGAGDRDIYADSSSVMMYSPLLPTQEDLVELAEFVVLETEEEVEAVTGASGWTTRWPFSVWNPPKRPQSLIAVPEGSRPSGDSRVGGKKSTDSAASGGQVRTQSPPRGWVPSPTKLSVQAFWWGYRLYLPPPVLEVLSDRTIEATKRAAMITTALTWFFNNLPVTSFPPAVQPALLLLQRISPFLGYIGTFISWSWGTIKSYDVGYGVYLTATWILPIALIPGTWFENDFPKSPSQSPIPLPPISLPGPSSSPPPSSGPPIIPGSPTNPPSQPTLASPTTSALTSPPTSPPTSLPASPPTSLPASPPASPPTSLPPFSPPPIMSPLLTPTSPAMPATPSSLPAEISPTPTSIHPPIPPTPEEPPRVPPAVAPGSPLMFQLLQSRRVPTVPLPDQGSSSQAKKQRKGKEREMKVKDKAKALFTRGNSK